MEENTTLEDIYSAFVSQISDNELASLTPQELDEELFMLYTKAMGFFTNIKPYVLDYILEEFDRKFEQLEINIIGGLMVLEWLKPQIYSITGLRSRLGDRDYQAFSSSKHLDSLQSLKQDTERNVHYWMGKYSLTNFIRENR